MTNLMDQSQSDLGGLQEKLLGPDYNYSANIKPPTELGMSSAGTFGALENDIGGLLSYVKVLVTGNTNASRTGKPLGTKFFLPTPVKCTDKATDQEVVRSIYINNVPDGTIPFISGASMGSGGITFPDFKGLVPGLLSNLGQINPLQILQAFTSGASPTCQKITMETIDAKNNIGSASAYVTNTDIQLMNDAWFTISPKPDTTEPKDEDEAFKTIQAETSLINEKGTEINYSKMPNDFIIKLYYTSLGLLGLYIFLKMMLRHRMK
jgi:hypothetical protein